MIGTSDDDIIVWDLSDTRKNDISDSIEKTTDDVFEIPVEKKQSEEDVISMLDSHISEINEDPDAYVSDDEEVSDNSVYEKKYFKIREVETILNESQPTIRFWETSFAELGRNFCSQRSRGGTRVFTKENIENLKLIKMLLRERRLTIEGAISEIRNERKRNAKDRALILLQETRDELNYLIDAYNCILHKNVNE